MSNLSLALASSSGEHTNMEADMDMWIAWQCNNSGVIPKANPRDLVREGGAIIIAIYVFAIAVVIALSIMITRFYQSPAFQRLSQPYRPSVYFITSLPWALASFNTVTLMLPASHHFTVGIQRTLFAFILFCFLQITNLQMGGQDKILESMGNKMINLAASPFCCFMCLKGSKRPLSANLFFLLKYLIIQMCLYQFFFLYIIMSLTASDELGVKSYTTLQILQYVSWFAGIWGIGMLKDFVGSDLDDLKFNTRRALIQGMANILILQNALVVKILGKAANIYPCYSPHISGATIAAFIDSTLIICWCLFFGVIDHKIYTAVPMEPSAVASNAVEDATKRNGVKIGQTGLDNSGFA